MAASRTRRKCFCGTLTSQSRTPRRDLPATRHDVLISSVSRQ